HFASLPEQIPMVASGAFSSEPQSSVVFNVGGGSPAGGGGSKQRLSLPPQSLLQPQSQQRIRVPPCVPLSVIDGRNSNGMLSVSLDVTIAPHVLGLSLLHHLVHSTFLDSAKTTAAMQLMPQKPQFAIG